MRQGTEQLTKYEFNRAVRAFSEAATIPEGHAGSDAAGTFQPGPRIEESAGMGVALAGGMGAGSAMARTGSHSYGVATAVSQGSGHTRAEVAESALGSAHAWSVFKGNAVAIVGRAATGSASATARHFGNAVAEVGDGASGSICAKTETSGSVTAFAGAAGNLDLENRGNDIRVEHHGARNLRMTSCCSFPFQLTCCCQDSLAIEIDEAGSMRLQSPRGAWQEQLRPGMAIGTIRKDGSLGYE